MDSSFDVPDPSDWLNTPVAQLSTVEAALRCQVCKDFFDTPMITSCSHTFCSLCIRRCITNDGRCPTCRAQEQAMKLRPNSIVQELVDEFQKARPVILQLGRDVQITKDGREQGSKKRKWDDTDLEEVEEVVKNGLGRRKTRSQNQRPSASRDRGAETIEDQKDGDSRPDDGLIACPICSERMKEEAVFSHLDVHNKPEPASKKHSGTARPNSFNIASSARQPPKAMDRLPQLNYSLLKDNALRKKLSELGIPNGGPRALVIRRHTEWVNLVNANCDSRRPRSKRELLHELDVWDKTQGRQISNGSGSVGVASSVMNKDFDGAAWAASHDNDFQALIARARKNPKPRTEVGNSSDAAVTPMPDDHEEDGRPSYTSGTAPESKTGQYHLPQDADKDRVSSSDPHRPMQASFVDLEAEA